MTLTVQGEVERVTFENEETGFRVLQLARVTGELQARRLTVVGVVPAVGPGTRVRVVGKLETDRRHGERLAAQSLVVVTPDTLEGIERYLGSGVVHGIGGAFAKRIVKYFGLDTLRVLDTEPQRLAEVPGIAAGRLQEIRSSWSEHRALSNTLIVLQNHGASPALAARIVQQFGEQAAMIVEQHPYRLAMSVAGVGFKTADRIARAQGLPLDHPERAQAGVDHQLRAMADSGHCYCERELLVERTTEMLSIAAGHVQAAIDALWAAEKLVVEEERVFLKKLHECEEVVAERLALLRRAPSQAVEDYAERLRSFEAQTGLELAPAQRQAVQAAAEQKLLVITGGPGVGKTTLVRAILHVMQKKGIRIQLAAPTGRAAKRLSESTGMQAQTLHRLLEVEGRGTQFARHLDNPLEVDLLIVDESSMIDIHMAKHLLLAVPPAARVVFVGDSDQLPSVGPGAFLADLIASKHIPVARLDVIFRQAGQSGIIENSHAILRGEEPVGASTPDGDFFIVWSKSAERAAETIRTLVQERIAERFGFDPVHDVQVLCPMHRGAAGTTALNAMLQAALNPDGRALAHGDGQLRVGDKVLQTKNDYEREVFNGDVGEIASIDAELPGLTVRFEGEQGMRLVNYERAELLQLTLAYATSIHKSQGSEYPAVVIPLLSAHYVMLSRNLLYTAVTRAKKLCVIVADKKALALALSETRKELRATGLAGRIERVLSA